MIAIAATTVNTPEVATVATYDVHAMPGNDSGSTPAARETTRAAATGTIDASDAPGALSE